MNGPATEASVEAAMSHIFLNVGDDLADFAPDYWKPCIHAASGLPSDPALECHFSADFLAVPGVAPTGASTHTEDEAALGSGASGVFHPGRGTTAPKLIFNKPPEFSEEARRAKFQGIATLRLTVDTSGQPTDIHIISPIGCGLDAQAVRAVEQWRFKPSEKDGEPIAAQIAVEVEFHLY
jgi:TonB family protein